MNNQEAFNLIWERSKSGVEASDGYGECLYRVNGKAEDLGNNSCFVGACIPSNLYFSDIEGSRVKFWQEDFEAWEEEGSPKAPKIKKLLEHFKGCDTEFLAECQDVHDFEKPRTWKSKLTVIAKKWGLVVPK